MEALGNPGQVRAAAAGADIIDVFQEAIENVQSGLVLRIAYFILENADDGGADFLR